jgi:hypothetical protein
MRDEMMPSVEQVPTIRTDSGRIAGTMRGAFSALASIGRGQALKTLDDKGE